MLGPRLVAAESLGSEPGRQEIEGSPLTVLHVPGPSLLSPLPEPLSVKESSTAAPAAAHATIYSWCHAFSAAMDQNPPKAGAK